MLQLAAAKLQQRRSGAVRVSLESSRPQGFTHLRLRLELCFSTEDGGDRVGSCAHAGGEKARDAAVRILRSGGSMSDSSIGSPGHCPAAELLSRLSAGDPGLSRLGSDLAAGAPPRSDSLPGEQQVGEPSGSHGTGQPTRMGRLSASASSPRALDATAHSGGAAEAMSLTAQRRPSDAMSAAAAAAGDEPTGFLTPKPDAGDDWLRRSMAQQGPPRFGSPRRGSPAAVGSPASSPLAVKAGETATTLPSIVLKLCQGRPASSQRPPVTLFLELNTIGMHNRLVVISQCPLFILCSRAQES